LSLRRCIDSAHNIPRDESKEFNQMTQAPKKQDKPTDPAYAGGEDETIQNRKSTPGENEPPVDETDDGPAAG
jgi:hypothetical protein